MHLLSGLDARRSLSQSGVLENEGEDAGEDYGEANTSSERISLHIYFTFNKTYLDVKHLARRCLLSRGRCR